MPFIESVPTTEYMIAVNLAPSSLSEPKLSPRPIVGARKTLPVSRQARQAVLSGGLRRTHPRRYTDRPFTYQREREVLRL